MKTVSAATRIDAPPARVWAGLTDLAAYPQWNPLFPEASGQIAVGSRFPPGGYPAWAGGL